MGGSATRAFALSILLISISQLVTGDDEYPYGACPSQYLDAFRLDTHGSFSSPQRGEQAIIYNSKVNKFFVVWAEESTNYTVLYGVHYNLDGSSGNIFKISDDMTTAPLKRAPKLAFNNNTGNYLVLFESPLSASTINLFFVFVNQNENPNPYVNTLGTDMERTDYLFMDSSVNYHYNSDKFYVAFTRQDSNGRNEVRVFRLDGEGNREPNLNFGAFEGSDPFVVVSPYGVFVVFEDANRATLQVTYYTQHGTIHNGIVASFDEGVKLINPQAVYSAYLDQYVILYEENVGGQSAVMISQNVVLNGTYFVAVGNKTYWNPLQGYSFDNFEADYDSKYDNVILVYEENHPTDLSVLWKASCFQQRHILFMTTRLSQTM